MLAQWLCHKTSRLIMQDPWLGSQILFQHFLVGIDFSDDVHGQ
jgi:hypothetical protein